MEYFGLVECSKETSSFPVIGARANVGTNNYSSAHYYDWINLRNPLGQHGNAGQPYSLAFRVKFWVPAHLILQENVRNIFYMQAKSDLLEGRLKVPDWDCAARLGALLAHGDEVKFDRSALTFDDSDKHRTILTDTDRTYADDDDDCKSIASDQSDITVIGCVSLGSLSSHSLDKSKKRKLSKQKLSFHGLEADIETNKVHESSPLRVYEGYVMSVEDDAHPMPANFLRQIAIEHSKLIHSSSKSAKYWLLQSIFKLPGFGVETFSGVRVISNNNATSVSRNRGNETADSSDYQKTRSSHSYHEHSSTQRCDISVGPHGLLIKHHSTPDVQTRLVTFFLNFSPNISYLFSHYSQNTI